MHHPIFINGVGSICATGHDLAGFWDAHLNGQTTIRVKEGTPQAALPDSSNQVLNKIAEKRAYSRLDRTVLMAIYAAREATKHIQDKQSYAVNIGSSRGATALFEQYHSDYSNGLPPIASPTTTLGNISSWVAQDLLAQQFNMSHSITCSTALHGLLNGVGWLEAGFCESVLVGGSEAPLTPFTFAQMQAMKIYSKGKQPHPCTPLMKGKLESDMVLGEGACIFSLSKQADRALAALIGVGFEVEPIRHSTAINKEGLGLEKAMKKALKSAKNPKIDAIIMHAPGTMAGEAAELHAIRKTFEELPYLTTTKNIIGHTFGASGAFSMLLAIQMMQQNSIITPAYRTSIEQTPPNEVKNVLINAIGFGGNAISVILQKY